MASMIRSRRTPAENAWVTKFRWYCLAAMAALIVIGLFAGCGGTPATVSTRTATPNDLAVCAMFASVTDVATADRAADWAVGIRSTHADDAGVEANRSDMETILDRVEAGQDMGTDPYGDPWTYETLATNQRLSCRAIGAA